MGFKLDIAAALGVGDVDHDSAVGIRDFPEFDGAFDLDSFAEILSRCRMVSGSDADTE
jgi:hypothetical protein